MSIFSGETLYCIITFILVYYSLIAAVVWFVILTYAWHMSFQALGKIKDRIDKKGAYFHLIAWCLPTVLTVTIMTLGEVDGNSVTGICFVGYANHTARVLFVLVPVLVGLLVGGYFLSRGRYYSASRIFVMSTFVIRDNRNNIYFHFLQCFPY